VPTENSIADFVRGLGNPIIVFSRFEELFAQDFLLLFGDRTRAMSMLGAIEKSWNLTRLKAGGEYRSGADI
jgi:hypothetical protein